MIKIFSVPWHVAHQWELTKLPNTEWHYLINHTRKWSEAVRPFPKNVKWVPYFDPAEKYDLAILHVDQQCLLDSLGKSRLFRHLKKVLAGKLPIIVINHGSICYPEIFNDMRRLEMAGEQKITDKEKISELQVSDAEGIAWAIKKMKELVGFADVMVVNSNQAAKEWTFGHPIIHGLDPAEWFDLKKEPRSTTFISQAGLGNKYYGRMLFIETKEILAKKYGIKHLWIGEEVEPMGFPSWDSYRKFIGGTLIYFNPTYGSPMPRTRTEAMLSGCAVVTTRHHDADSFIKHGENGYLCADNPEDAARWIADLYFDYKKAIKIGQAGKETAQKLFSKERFQADWIALLERVLGKKL